MDLHLGLIIPLGRRWKSNSAPSTTTVCPALFPPCEITLILEEIGQSFVTTGSRSL